MSAVFEYHRSRVRVTCTMPGCGKQVYRGESEADARKALGHHNWNLHPNVFPRWNPNAEVFEEKKRERRLDASDI